MLLLRLHRRFDRRGNTLLLNMLVPFTRLFVVLAVGIFYTIRRRRVSLGVRHSWPAIWESHWLLHGLVELFWLDL